ncbi:MAG: RNA methyltransferase [Flavobacteriales bacterium]|nr:RNA methyltransferase [Flavobacteriales bacterium]
MSLTKNEIKFIKSLQQKKFREQEGVFVVEGPKLLQELNEAKALNIVKVYATERWNGNPGSEVDFEVISEKDLERISGFKSPNEVLAIVEIPKTAQVDLNSIESCLILDGINDPGNLGTILRTADWFGISTVFASAESVEVYNPKVIQSSMGAIFRSTYVRTELSSTIQELKEAGFEVLGAEMNGTALNEKKFDKKFALVMGSESHGISETLQSLLDESITIPRFGKSESLNVAMACGIILSHSKL